jgi:hypothetical protein
MDFNIHIYCVVCTPSYYNNLKEESDEHPQISKNYYTIDEACPDLIKIYTDIEAIKKSDKCTK